MLEKGKAHIERGLPMFHSFLFDDADLQFKTAANTDVGCLGYHPVLAIVTGTGHLTLCLSALAPMQKAAHEGMTWRLCSMNGVRTLLAMLLLLCPPTLHTGRLRRSREFVVRPRANRRGAGSRTEGA